MTLMAKSPTDRPWDAAAVGVKLTELRDKAERGAPVAMVWPSTGPWRGQVRPRRGRRRSRQRDRGRHAPSRLGRKSHANQATLRNRFTSRPYGYWVGFFVAQPLHGRDRAPGRWPWSRIGGFIAYLVWPPSAEYLYKQAETLMASRSRADWRTARDEYIKPLDDRFPNHPYREQTREWRDKILLEDAESRGQS